MDEISTFDLASHEGNLSSDKDDVKLPAMAEKGPSEDAAHLAGVATRGGEGATWGSAVRRQADAIDLPPRPSPHTRVASDVCVTSSKHSHCRDRSNTAFASFVIPSSPVSFVSSSVLLRDGAGTATIHPSASNSPRRPNHNLTAHAIRPATHHHRRRSRRSMQVQPRAPSSTGTGSVSVGLAGRNMARSAYLCAASLLSPISIIQRI
jgi:hypothetical protein